MKQEQIGVDTFQEYDELNLPDPVHGQKLQEKIEASQEERTPLVNGLLYEKNVIQWFADDGLGKSTALLNFCLEASAGVPVFNYFECPRPLNIYWICAERPIDEPMERIKVMGEKIKYNVNNIAFDDKFQLWDVMNAKHRWFMVERIRRAAALFENMKVDLVVIDPIYALTSGKLTDDTGAGFVNEIFRKIQFNLDCSIIYTHHTNRGSRNKEGERQAGDMYGSRFLSANLTGQYHLKKTQQGIVMQNKKNTYGNLIEIADLVYDDMSQTLSLSINANSTTMNIKEKAFVFLRQKHQNGGFFLMSDMSHNLNSSLVYVRKLIRPLVKSGHILKEEIGNQKARYKVVKTV